MEEIRHGGGDRSHITFSTVEIPDDDGDENVPALRGEDAPAMDSSSYAPLGYEEDNSSGASPCGTYDYKAAAYARYWFDKKNSDYPFYGNDGTNFIRQAMKAASSADAARLSRGAVSTSVLARTDTSAADVWSLREDSTRCDRGLVLPFGGGRLWRGSLTGATGYGFQCEDGRRVLGVAEPGSCAWPRGSCRLPTGRRAVNSSPTRPPALGFAHRSSLPAA